MILPRPKIDASTIPEEWPGIVREIFLREGNALRGPDDRAVIEVKSLKTNQWCALELPGGGVEFTEFDGRNAILDRIRRAPNGG